MKGTHKSLRSRDTIWNNIDDDEDVIPIGVSQNLKLRNSSEYKFVPHKCTAYAALILEDRTDTEYEDILILDEYQMGEVLEEGNFEPWKVSLSDDDDKWKYAQGKDYVPAIKIDIADIPKSISKNRNVALCAYNATNEYMQHWLGFSLDNDDKDWYKLHYMCTSDGLPQNNSFIVLQQLVEPYGVGISHIVVPRNARRFEGYHPFIAALGCNPFFLVDGNTTNEEALLKMFPDENKRNEMREIMFAMWRFECSDDPPKGTVSMRQFGMDSVGHNGGANYFGPRARLEAVGWHMSIKFDRLQNISYLKELKLPEYAEYEGSSSFNYWMIKDRSDKTLYQIRTIIADRNRAKWSTTPSFQSPLKITSKPDEPDKPINHVEHEDVFAGKILAYSETCETCQRSIGSHYRGQERVCQWCGDNAFIGLVDKSEIGMGFIDMPDEDLKYYEDDSNYEDIDSDVVINLGRPG